MACISTPIFTGNSLWLHGYEAPITCHMGTNGTFGDTSIPRAKSKCSILLRRVPILFGSKLEIQKTSHHRGFQNL
jgi:hypothetical protein